MPGEKADEISFEPTGHILLTLAGKSYDLRPPTFGELRDLQTFEESNATEEVTVGEGPQAKTIRAYRQDMDGVEDRLKFWQHTIKILSGDDAPLVESLPPWLGADDMTVRAMGHWLRVPIRARGT